MVSIFTNSRLLKKCKAYWIALLDLIELLALILLWSTVVITIVCVIDFYENVKKLINSIKKEYKEYKNKNYYES